VGETLQAQRWLVRLQELVPLRWEDRRRVEGALAALPDQASEDAVLETLREILARVGPGRGRRRDRSVRAPARGEVGEG